MPAWVFGLLIAEGITSSLMGSLAEVSGLPVVPGLTSSAAVRWGRSLSWLPLVFHRTYACACGLLPCYSWLVPCWRLGFH